MTPLYCYNGLGSFHFARRYYGNKYFFLFLLVLRCFTSQGTLLYHKDKDCKGLLYRVSPFGDLRIKGYYTPPRSLSQLRHVLHRLLKSRHPPYALKFPVKKFTNHNSPIPFAKRIGIHKIFFPHFIVAIRPLEFKIFSLFPAKTLGIQLVSQKAGTGLSFQISSHTYHFTKQKTAF